MHPRTSELLGFLDGQHAILERAVAAVPAGMRDRPPAEGRWSAAQVVEHLAIVHQRLADALGQRIVEARANGLAAEGETASVLPHLGLERVLDRSDRITAPARVHPTGLGFDEAWAALDRAGRSVRAVLREADGLALGTLTMPHLVFGPLTFYEWFGFIGGHETRHAAQIREDYGLTAEGV